jgi:classical protein kinase C/novel protein kinase C epsilon type
MIRMRQGTSNPSVQQSLDTQIREGQKNISYLQESLSKLQLSQSNAPPLPPKDAGASQEANAFLTLPTPRAPYSQQPGSGIPKPRNYTKLGMKD